MRRVLLWDFDGTLAWRPGLWSGCLLEVLDEQDPGHSVARSALAPYLQDTFPWHHHEVAHPELCEPSLWWRHIETNLARAYEGVGYSSARAAELAERAHERYLDVDSWQLFDDTLPVLARLHSMGWRHIIVSNHVPELATIVQELGLASLIDAVVSSAVTGHEKPSPHAFKAALEVAAPVERAWMVGDSVEADIRGAEAVGIPGILVRRAGEDVVWQSADLWGVIPIVERDPPP